MKNIKKTSLLAALILALAPLAAFAAVTITINPNVPGTNAANAGPAGIVSNFYQFAVMIGGILALGAIVWGGVRYTMAAGNPSGQGEGKKWIMAAIYGLLLLLGAYLLLNTINPDIVSLGLPGLEGATAITGGGVGGPPGPVGGPSGPPGARCQAPASGPCSVANLQNSCFGSNAQIAGGVCNVESGGNTFAKSGTDKCDDGSPVSFGLFQINITANNVKDPTTGQTLNCRSAFSNVFTGSNPHCTVTNRTLYQQCANAAMDPTTNINFACGLSRGGTFWAPWGPATRRACGV